MNVMSGSGNRLTPLFNVRKHCLLTIYKNSGTDFYNLLRYIFKIGYPVYGILFTSKPEAYGKPM